MGDAVRINPKRFRFIYESSFRTWAQLYSHVVRVPNLPTHCLFVKDAFSQQPFLTPDLSLKHEKNQVLVTGSSVWGSTGTDCHQELPSFQQLVQIGITTRNPTSLSISGTGQSDSDYASWFACKDDYVAVLVLAWAYILSARWAEVIPGSCIVRYTERQATYYDDWTGPLDQDVITIDIGNASLKESRWWAAILAPGQGWQATMALEHDTYSSPWSTSLQPKPHFLLSPGIIQSCSPQSTPSFSDACKYISAFCIRRDIMDQSHAALAAVLLFPYRGGRQTLQLPTPRICVWKNPPSVYPNGQLQCDWIYQSHFLDKMLTLSCYTRGIRPMLLSVFYEPSIECNAVTPWLQGTLAAVESLCSDRPYIFGRMCMERQPRVACLWLGITILGLQKELLQAVRFGQIPINLNCAAWSGTIQSFIQQPVTNPLVAHGRVGRADECRLLFLSQTTHQARVPICQWKPFGSTPLDDVDVEVRVHSECEDHGLQYKGFSWDYTEDKSIMQLLGEAIFHSSRSLSTVQELSGAEQTPICYKALDREKEVISENATRSVFGWLRFEGYARHESGIWKHDWFDMSDSDEEDVGWEEVYSDDDPKTSSRVKAWASGLSSAKLSYPSLDDDAGGEVLDLHNARGSDAQ